MKLALRVLNSISVQKNAASRVDVQELRKLVPGHLAKEPTEELARDVIQEALKRHRAKAAAGEQRTS